MDEEKKQGSYEEFLESVDEYTTSEGHDMLTDERALSREEEAVAADEAQTHGEKVRLAREQKGFSVEELGREIGIDADTLARVESGEALLPLGQLIKLTKSLSMSMSDVIAAGEAAFTIVRADERRAHSRFGVSKQKKHGYQYESLAPRKKNRKMEPFIVTLEPASADEPSSHDGQEFIYVLEGRMEVVVEDTREVLEAGDAIYYDSTSTHLVRAYGDKPAKILAVITS